MDNSPKKEKFIYRILRLFFKRKISVPSWVVLSILILFSSIYYITTSFLIKEISFLKTLL